MPSFSLPLMRHSSPAGPNMEYMGLVSLDQGNKGQSRAKGGGRVVVRWSRHRTGCFLNILSSLPLADVHSLDALSLKLSSNTQASGFLFRSFLSQLLYLPLVSVFFLYVYWKMHACVFHCGLTVSAQEARLVSRCICITSNIKLGVYWHIPCASSGDILFLF